MCNPLLIVTAISAISSAAAQNQSVKAQNATNDNIRQNSITNMNENIAQVEVAKSQAAAQAGQKQLANNLEAQRAMSTARVQVGENGINGLSVDALLSEMDGNRNRYNDSVTANLTDTVTNLNNQRTSIRNGAASQVNALQTPAPVDYLGAALKIGGAAYQSYSTPAAKKG